MEELLEEELKSNGAVISYAVYTELMKEVTFLSDNLTIDATLVLPTGTVKQCPGVVIFHGMTSSKASYIPLAEELAEHGIAALAVNMRGHGESGGNFNKSTVKEALNDALAAYDFLAAQPGIDADRIGFAGGSVGAILAAMATTQRSVKSMVLRAPAAYTPEMMQLSMAGTMVNEGRQFYEIDDLSATPAGQAVADYTGNLLVVASGEDATIPAKITDGYIEIASNASKKELKVLEGAPHNLSGTKWKDECNHIMCEWFVNTL